MNFILRGTIHCLSYSGTPIHASYRGEEKGVLKFDIDKGQALLELDRHEAERMRDDITKILRRTKKV